MRFNLPPLSRTFITKSHQDTLLFGKEKWVSHNPRNGDMIAATEMAMPALHAHDDDFLFEIQHPVEPSSSDSANAFLKRTVSRIRKARQIDLYQGPSAGWSFWARILRTLKKSWTLGL